LQTKHVDRKLLKLNALSRLIQNSKVDIFDAREYLKYICLNQNPCQLKKTLVEVEKFNKRLMEKMTKLAPDRSAVPQFKAGSTTAPNSDVSWLQTSFSPHFWSSSQKLFKALVRNLGSCKRPNHSAMFSLDGIKRPKSHDEQSQFVILFPSCPEQGSWQETSCRVLYSR
jgi:hypothetical protein